MIMKKFMAIATALLLSVQTCAAAEGITVTLNGEKLEFDAEPRIVSDRTMVPMRTIFESLGAQVQWVADTQMILASKGNLLMALKIDSPVIIVNDLSNQSQRRIELDAAPFLADDRTLVPLRAVSETLNASVEWDADTRTVSIIQ